MIGVEDRAGGFSALKPNRTHAQRDTDLEFFRPKKKKKLDKKGWWRSINVPFVYDEGYFRIVLHMSGEDRLVDNRKVGDDLLFPVGARKRVLNRRTSVWEREIHHYMARRINHSAEKKAQAVVISLGEKKNLCNLFDRSGLFFHRAEKKRKSRHRPSGREHNFHFRERNDQNFGKRRGEFRKRRKEAEQCLGVLKAI